MRKITLDNGFQMRWLTTEGFIHGRQKLAKYESKEEEVR